jgi:hypothetical protein
MKGSIGAPKWRTKFCPVSSTESTTFKFVFGIFLSLACAPFSAHAQVVISEIMYNPAGSNTGREWIELYNQGASDVTMVAGGAAKTWRVQDGSGNNALHTLTDPTSGTSGRGSLSIPAGGYLVIAADPNEFISGEYAGGSYSVIKSSLSLNNAGTTISLIDQTSGSPVTIDTTAYTSAQGGSDDGASLQRQADGSWIAALPTPGAGNSTTPYVAPPSSSSASSSSQTSAAQTSVSTSSYVPPPAPSLYADAGADRSVIVGADVEFDGLAYDKNQNPLDQSSVRFSWNFGDGVSAEGAAVMHHFEYPGRYAVVLSIAQNKSAMSDTLVVNAEPAALSFSLLPDGGVAIGNNSGHDLDLSEWIVRQGGSPFAAQLILPANSEILAGQTMHIGRDILKFSADTNTSLEYPNGTVALGAGQANAGAISAPAPTHSTAPAPVPTTQAISATDESPAPKSTARVTSDTISSSQEPSSEDAAASSSQTATVQQAALPFKSGRLWWWVGAFALAAIGGIALIASRSVSKKEWDIIEQKD